MLNLNLNLLPFPVTDKLSHIILTGCADNNTHTI